MGWEALANLFVSPAAVLSLRGRVWHLGLRLSVLSGDRGTVELSGMGGPYDLRHEGRAGDLQQEGSCLGSWDTFWSKTVPPLPPCPLAMLPPGPQSTEKPEGHVEVAAEDLEGVVFSLKM